MSDAEEGHEGAAAAPAKGGGMKKIMLALVGVLVLGGGGVGYMVISKRASAETHEGKDDEKEDHMKVTPIPLQPITVNLRHSNGGSHLKVTVVLEITSKKTKKTLEDQKHRISDYLIGVFSECEIEDVEGRNELKRKIKAGINEILDDCNIDKVYFTEFITG